MCDSVSPLFDNSQFLPDRAPLWIKKKRKDWWNERGNPIRLTDGQLLRKLGLHSAYTYVVVCVPTPAPSLFFPPAKIAGRIGEEEEATSFLLSFFHRCSFAKERERHIINQASLKGEREEKEDR